MPTTKSAKKRMRQNEARHARNQTVKARTRSAVRKAREAIAAQDAENAPQAVQKACSELDRAVSLGVIHRNNADRRKSRLVNRLNETLAAQ